jgi:hypothetical protein
MIDAGQLQTIHVGRRRLVLVASLLQRFKPPDQKPRAKLRARRLRGGAARDDLAAP